MNFTFPISLCSNNKAWSISAALLYKGGPRQAKPGVAPNHSEKETESKSLPVCVSLAACLQLQLRDKYIVHIPAFLSVRILEVFFKRYLSLAINFVLFVWKTQIAPIYWFTFQIFKKSQLKPGARNSIQVSSVGNMNPITLAFLPPRLHINKELE